MQITEISPDTDMANHPMDRIWDDSDIPRHGAQVEAIKQHGSLAAIELGHGGARARNITTGLSVIGPSNTPVLRPEVPLQAKAMDKADIRAFREAHKAAALRARKAGYDILYVYASHDISILNHFLSANINKRGDEYGGSFENRIRLLREVLEDTLEVASGDLAVALRFGVAEPEKKNGLRHDGEGRDVVEALAEVPDLWDVNISGWSNDSAASRFSEEGFQLPYTDFVKSLTTKPVVGVGRFTSPDMMVSLIQKGRLDLIGAARPSIADPFLPTKIKEGRIEDIRECIGCNICVSMDGYGLPIRCTQNPTISEEWRRDWHPEKVTPVNGEQKVLIVGSGPAGLECALTLARAGVEVSVAERRPVLGGRVTRESGLTGLSAWGRVKDYRLYQLQQMGNVSLYPGSELTAPETAEFDADHIFVASGAHWRGDGFGGVCFEALSGFSDTALTPDDILDGLEPEGSVVIYDDDHYYMGSVLATHLARKGISVALVCPLPVIGTWMDYTLELPRAISQMHEAGVKMYPNVRAIEWADDALHVVRADTGEEVDSIRANTLLTVGSRMPDTALFDALINAPSRPDSVSSIGDCVAPGIIQAAVLSGHTAAMTFLGDVPADGLFKREAPVLF